MAVWWYNQASQPFEPILGAEKIDWVQRLASFCKRAWPLRPFFVAVNGEPVCSGQ